MKTRFIVVLLILLVAHLPLPCYDIDGENQGVPTHGIFDPAAWHLMFLGVLPEDDIDRGPINSQHQDEHGGGSAFDAPFVVCAMTAPPDQVNCAYRPADKSPALSDILLAPFDVSTGSAVFRTFSSSFFARSQQSWRQYLRLMLV